jgi:hypothetical protein
MGKMGSRRHAFLVLSVLALVAMFVQACSDNKGPAGPTFGAGQTGHADTAAQIVVQVAINPNTIELGRRAGITVLVTNLNGRPLQGRHVQLSTNVGQLDVVDGFTDAGGKFVSFIRITEQDAANAAGLVQATVIAFVEGATGQGTVNFGGTPVLTINPAAISFGTLSNVNGACTASRPFAVAGGVPPYDISSQAAGSSVSGGVYRITTNIGPIADTIRVVDSTGATVTAVVTGTCS